MKDMFWSTFIYPKMEYFRKKRAKIIKEYIPNIDELHVCDIGGSRHYWEKVHSIIKPKRLTILNIADDRQSKSHTGRYRELRIEVYDGKKIPYPDKHFDVIICNSVIEHVPKKFRKGLLLEIDRCSKNFFIQTPSLIFPIEPHFMIPFVHWLPRAVSRKLIVFGLYNIFSRPGHEKLSSYFDEVELLSLKEFKSYLPSGHVKIEYFMGIPKSYTIFKLDSSFK